MSKKEMPHLIVVLPGITGSVLVKDGVDVWAPTRGAIWRGLWSRGETLQALQLDDDDPTADSLGDGVEATRLVTDAHIVPGLVKIDGYSGLVSALHERFDLVEETENGSEPANLLQFPYDWRRDNRVAARKLQAAVNRLLSRWRKHSGYNDAKIIVIAHSMGGLISQYFLECLEGWRDCLALITFGTPFRGSPAALGYLANGYKKAFIDLTNVLRSCTSVYQLLPRYEMLDVNGELKRIAETGPIPSIDAKKANDALAFHREIETAIKNNESNEIYLRNKYKTLPFVGVYQPTLQSAIWKNNIIEVGSSLPKGFPDELDGGDGTVPRCSATPVEMSREFRETFHAERHSSLQTNWYILDDVLNRIEQMVAADALANIRGSDPRSAATGLSLTLDDLYAVDEPVLVQIESVKCNPDSVSVQLTNSDTREVSIFVAAFSNDRWKLEIPALPSGTYSIEAKADGGIAPPVHDVFVISNE
jgi:hypothetical protein